MAIDRLANLPAGADVFLDANIFIYAFSGQSNECRDLLRRCATENVFGITTLEVINEVTHRLMLAEAVAKGIITRQYAAALKGKWRDVAMLSDYWVLSSRIFDLNILIIASDQSRLHRAQTVRSSHGVLTTDSLILAAMNEYGIDCLASRDGDFDHISSLTIYKPTDR
jgi:predicted nucleic acid-binding protein